MRLKVAIILTITFGVIILFTEKFIVNSKQKADVSSSEKYSVILTGFGSVNLLGKASGEIAPFFSVMQDPKNLKGTLNLCEASYEGKIYGNNVLIASTGMGKVASTACVTQLLENYGDQVKEVIFVGIAGISRVRLSNGEETKMGDVCINFLAFDYDMQYYTSDAAGIFEANPTYWDLDSEFKSKFTVGSKYLTDELIRNASDVRIWSQSECIEATSDSFWHDIRSDNRAREMGAYYLNKDPKDVVVFTSMESAAVGKVVEWWNEKGGTDIAFAYVRSASNFDMPPVNPDGTPQESGRESLADRSEEDTNLAIIKASKPVLEMFKDR